jgi:hypothetical protein
MDGPELHYVFGNYGLDAEGRLFDCLYDGHWLLRQHVTQHEL